MTDLGGDVITTVNTLVGWAYVILIGAIGSRQTIRLIALRGKSPRLLIRDNVLFWCLALLLIIPLIFGVTLRDNIWWTLLRGALGLIALGIWAYYEFFVIGKEDKL